MMATPQTLRPEGDRRWIAPAIFACICNVSSLLLTHFLSVRAWGEAIGWDCSDIMLSWVWLAPIPVVVIFRRSPVVTVVYALILFAILALRLYDVAAFYTFGRSALAKMTRADLLAYVISAFSLFVLVLWAANLLTNRVFDLVKGIIGAFRDG